MFVLDLDRLAEFEAGFLALCRDGAFSNAAFSAFQFLSMPIFGYGTNQLRVTAIDCSGRRGTSSLSTLIPLYHLLSSF